MKIIPASAFYNTGSRYITRVAQPVNILDNNGLELGTDQDIVLYPRSTALTADAEITGVIVGTSDHQGVAANSLIASNITASGDIGFYVNNGGNSLEAMLIDTSALTIYLGFGTFTNVTFSAANSTNNTTFTVGNTSNAAAASHSIVDIQVGGTTSTGDPQLRLTVPGGTSYYIATDNSDSDILKIGVGTAVGTTTILKLYGLATGWTSTVMGLDVVPQAITLTDGASNSVVALITRAFTTTAPNTTPTKTSLWSTVVFAAQTIAQSGGAITVNAATGLDVVPLIASTSVTITHNSGIRIRNSAQVGTTTNLSGLYVEALTGGGTQNIQILLANGSTEPTAAPTDTAGIYAIDVGAASVLGFVQETAVVTPAGDFALTSKWIVRINGVSYAIGMTTTLT